MMRLLDWIASSLGYVRREFPRVQFGGDAISRGERWEAFYTEEGGLADMLTKLRRQYFEASAGLPFSDLDKRYEYALADRVARELDREVRTVIETGRIRAKERAFAESNAALTR